MTQVLPEDLIKDVAVVIHNIDVSHVCLSEIPVSTAVKAADA